MSKIIFHLRFILTQSSILVGGQAVIEGVMMRVPGAYATAVRDTSGKIHIDKHKHKSKSDKYPLLKKPLLRGILGLFESLKIGYSTLQWSADIISDESINNKKTNKLVDFLLTILSFSIAISLFFIAPIGLTTWIFNIEQNAFSFNFISGIFRVIFFLTYLILISFMKDIKRLFQYHGAEHKIVYNFESGKKLCINNAKKFPTQHPRCGTSFMFIIMLVAIITFAILDSIVMFYVNELKVWMRLILHIPFIPIVAGLGYEVLKITAKHRNNLFFKILAKPGLWLQNITTKEPDDSQIEVAIRALEEAFGKKLSKFTNGKTYVAEAIG